MSKITKSVAAVVTALACAGLGYAPSAFAAQNVPLTLTQQGRLLDNTGVAVDGVQLTFTFTLYTAATGGAGIWTENQSITPDKGYFSAKIGDTTAFPSTIFDGSRGTLYLGIKIGSDAEMAPRQELTSVPFALLALNAASATHAASADTATSATSATSANTALTAGSAMTASSATNASHATVADTVSSISGNFSVKYVSQLGSSAGAPTAAQTTSLSCDSGTVIVGGFCLASGGTLSGSYLNTSTSLSGKVYNCTCSGAGCLSYPSIICAK
jgi:hypothetical protein